MSGRSALSDHELSDAAADVSHALNARVRQKGHRSFASTHEALGILKEEYHELTEAIHDKGDHEQVVHELTDIAVGCIFAIASINAGKVDW